MFYVYCITNTVNGKKYIGKTNDPKTRWYAHRNNADRLSTGRTPQHCNPVHRAMAKYGVDQFTFEIIEALRTEGGASLAEAAWIKELKTNICRHGSKFGYNLTDGGEGCSGRVAGPEERARLSQINKGRKWSPETVEKRRQSLISTWASSSQDTKRREVAAHMKKWRAENPGVCSDETRAKMRLAKLGKTRFSHEQIAEMARLYAEEQLSVREIAKRFGCSHGTVTRLTGNKPGRGSEATRRRISKKMTGRVLPIELRLKSAKLTEEQVLEIDRLSKTGLSQQAIADQFGVAQSTVYKIIHRKRWAHLFMEEAA